MRIVLLPFVTRSQLETANLCLEEFSRQYPVACREQYNVWKAEALRRKQAADAKRRRMNDGTKKKVDPKPRGGRFNMDECVKPNMHFIQHLIAHIAALGTALSAYVYVALK